MLGALRGRFGRVCGVRGARNHVRDAGGRAQDGAAVAARRAPVAAARAISIILGLAIILDGVAEIVLVFGISKFEQKVTNAINNVKDAFTGKLNDK